MCAKPKLGLIHSASAEHTAQRGHVVVEDFADEADVRDFSVQEEARGVVRTDEVGVLRDREALFVVLEDQRLVEVEVVRLDIPSLPSRRSGKTPSRTAGPCLSSP